MKPVSRKTAAAANNQEDEPSLSPMKQERLEKELMEEDVTEEHEEDVIMTTIAPLITQKELEKTSVPQKEINTEINENELKDTFRKQILNLRMQQLDCQNYEESENLKKLIENAIATLNGFDTRPSNNVEVKQDEVKNNIKKIHDIPLFQLSDDPVETRTDNKIIFDVAENFISNFETIIKTNNVDINKEWKHYLMRSFLYSKNDKHQRFYKTQINDLDEDIEWPVVRNKIMDRYGDSGNMDRNLQKFVTMTQGRKESIREFMDRYLELFQRLPIKNSDSNMIDVVTFINKLLPRTKQEVEKVLKKENSNDDYAISRYPKNLDQLFIYIVKHISEIQEAIIVTLTNDEQQNMKRKNEYEHQPTRRMNKPYYEKPSMPMPMPMPMPMNNTNKTKNICRYCKKADFDYAHLRICDDYLKSDAYKKYQQYKDSRMKQVQILFVDKKELETKIPLYSHYSELYDYINEDIQEAYDDSNIAAPSFSSVFCYSPDLITLFLLIHHLDTFFFHDSCYALI